MTQINNPTTPPPVDPALKAEVTFCVQGVVSAPASQRIPPRVANNLIIQRASNSIFYVHAERDRNIACRSFRVGNCSSPAQRIGDVV